VVTVLDPVAHHPYADPDEFIREVTDRIWVDRDIAHITENYEPDSVVHGGLGTTVGRDGVLQGSLMRIATGPAHVGQAEDVVWEARGRDAFLSSHLVLTTGPELVGGRPVRVRSRLVANCLYRRGRMVEEWLVRDELALCLQRGLDPDEVARGMLFRGFTGSITQPAPADVLAAGDSGPRPDDHRAACELVLELVDLVWNQRRLHEVKRLMVRDLFLHTIGDQTVTRPAGYQEDLLHVLAPFPAGQFEVRDVQTNRAERYAGLRVAVLWKMRGAYEGVARYGPRTGAPVELLGVSQFLVQEGRVVREVRVYDEISLRAQINSTRGDGVVVDANIY
jgi:hypothetical protein